MMLKPIKDKKSHEAAKRRIQELIQAPVTEETTDEIEILATLIEKYELDTISTDTPSALGAIKLRMEQKGMTGLFLI